MSAAKRTGVFFGSTVFAAPGSGSTPRLPAPIRNAVSRLLLAVVSALAGLDASAQTGLPADVQNAIRRIFGADELRYFDGVADLNGDGKDEILVYVVGPMVCGTGGCKLLVFAPEGTGHRLVSSISVVQPPVRASLHRSSGWRDLIVHVAGGGAKSRDVALAFDGKSYPTNPTVSGPRVKAASTADAQMLIKEFASMTDGKVLAAASASGSPTGPTTPAAGAQPSFDCARASSVVEKLVCGDASLAALDRKLADAYGKGVAPNSDWPEPDRQASRARQREWIAERNACAKQKEIRTCVSSSYQRRLSELRIQNGELTAPQPVGYRCKGLEGQPVTAAFYETTELPSAVLTVGNRQVVTFITRSGSGAKYSAKGVEFWEHHGEARLEWFGKTYSCKAA